MTLIFFALGIIAAIFGMLWWRRRERDRLLLETHTIAAGDLHRLLCDDGPFESRPQVLDVRQPLDLLAYSEVIPGAIRIPPKEIIANPDVISRDADVVVYCTCPGNKTSKEIVEKALKLNFHKIRLLQGGIEAWKAKGYRVDPYKTAFHLDTPA
jgi:rhodanese-related sulfurtransferase